MDKIISNPIIWLVIIIVILVLYKRTKETYSPAAMLQLTAKGPQDTYLSNDAWKYIPPWYYGYRYGGWYSGYPWHISTRLGKKPYYW